MVLENVNIDTEHTEAQKRRKTMLRSILWQLNDSIVTSSSSSTLLVVHNLFATDLHGLHREEETQCFCVFCGK
jgi:hypothetical protein